MHHRLQDERSLMMHPEAVRMLQADPLLANKALSILERWEGHVSAQSKPLRDKWKVIIAQRDWTSALEESERGKQLRQASPLAILLPTEVRLQIIRATRAAHS